jgi:hypothetical protein
MWDARFAGELAAELDLSLATKLEPCSGSVLHISLSMHVRRAAFGNSRHLFSLAGGLW